VHRVGAALDTFLPIGPVRSHDPRTPYSLPFPFLGSPLGPAMGNSLEAIYPLMCGVFGIEHVVGMPLKTYQKHAMVVCSYNLVQHPLRPTLVNT
jgi:hypothetical protein